MSSSQATQSASAKPLAPVSFWYIAALVSFSLGTSAVNFCLITVLQRTLKPYTDSTALIGTLTALISMSMIWATPFAAWKSDRIWTRFGRRKPVVLAMAPVAAVTLLLLPHCTSLWMIGVMVFVLTVALAALLGMITPAIGDSVSDKQRPLATAMWHFTANGLGIFVMSRYVLGLMDPGVHRVGPSLPVSIRVHGAGHWPYSIACAIFVCTSIAFLLVMRERYVAPRSGEKFRLFSYGREIVQVREHLLIYVILLFQPMFVLVGSWYFPKLATEKLGLSLAQYGNAHSWGAIILMLTCVPLGYLFNHVRHRRGFTIVACLLALVPTTFGLFFMKSAAGMAFFFAAQQFAFAIFRLNFIPYVIEYTTPKSVGTILGFTNAVNGIVRFTMVPLFGLLVDAMGKDYRLPLWGGYVGVAVCVGCLLAMRPPEKVRHLIDAEVFSNS